MVVLLALLSFAAYAQPLFRATPGQRLAIDETRLSYQFDEENAQHVVRFEVALAGVAGLQIAFHDFHLPPGAAVRLYAVAEDGAVLSVAGPYEGAGPVQTGEFWSAAVAGNPVVVELRSYEPLGTLPFTMVEVAGGEVAPPPGEAKWQPAADLVEGDILMQPADKHLRAGVSVGRDVYLWPGGVVPYSVEAGLPNTARINAAVSHWNTQLNGTLRLVQRTTENAYIEFVRPSSAGVCASYVGRMGMSAQPVQIGDQCSTGNVIHEIGHVVGLYHEHTRADRSDHVRVMQQNIQADAVVNFVIAPDSEEQGSYDFESIMHYGPYAFSSNGQPTLVTIPEGISIGQRFGLSSGDVAAVRSFYAGLSSGGGTSGAGTSTAGGSSGGTVTPPAASMVAVTIGSSPAWRLLLLDGVPMPMPVTVTWTLGSAHTVAVSNESSGDTEYTFTRWSDGGAASHTVTASAAMTSLVATYATRFRLSMEVRPPGAGSATLRPAGTNGLYASGAVVNVTASAASGYCFTGWSGTIPVTSPAVAMTLNKSYDVVAEFQPGAVTVPSSFGVPAVGGTYSVGVSATSGCIWSAATNGSWITIGTPYGASASAMRISIRANASGAARSALIIVNGKAILVQQSAR